MPIVTWRRWSRRQKVQGALAALAILVGLAAAITYTLTGDGLSFSDDAQPTASYLTVFILVALDAVFPIFPGETTLNAAATAASQGALELTPIIVMGAIGAIVGDSALFWLARMYSRKIESTVTKAKANRHVRTALAVMDSSAPVLIVGGRYVPGMRFVVNATMGLSTIRYREFVGWSVLSGVLWSAYTCVLAYQIGVAVGEFPLASIVISGLVTTVALGIVMLSVRRHRRAARVSDDGQTEHR